MQKYFVYLCVSLTGEANGSMHDSIFIVRNLILAHCVYGNDETGVYGTGRFLDGRSSPTRSPSRWYCVVGTGIKVGIPKAIELLGRILSMEFSAKTVLCTPRACRKLFCVHCSLQKQFSARVAENCGLSRPSSLRAQNSLLLSASSSTENYFRARGKSRSAIQVLCTRRFSAHPSPFSHL